MAGMLALEELSPASYDFVEPTFVSSHPTLKIKNPARAGLFILAERVGLRFHIPVRAAVRPAKAVQNRSMRFCRTHARGFSSHPQNKKPGKNRVFYFGGEGGIALSHPCTRRCAAR